MLHVNAAKICGGGNLLTLRAKFLRTKCVKPALFTVNMPAYNGCQWFLVGFQANKASRC